MANEVSRSAINLIVNRLYQARAPWRRVDFTVVYKRFRSGARFQNQDGKSDRRAPPVRRSDEFARTPHRAIRGTGGVHLESRRFGKVWSCIENRRLTAAATRSLNFSRMDRGDEAAVENARRGDRDAFRALVERHGRAVFQLAYRMTGNPIDAEDIAQETFLKAWREFRRFDGRASFATWLHRICANCSLDHIRARNRRGELRAPVDPDAPDPLDQIAAAAPSPERLAASAQMVSSG